MDKVKISLKTLKDIAKKRKIEKYDTLKKHELIKKIFGGAKMDTSSSSKMDTSSNSSSNSSSRSRSGDFKIPFRYTMTEILGQGTFGFVVKAIDNISKNFVAIKMQKQSNDIFINSFLNEINTLINISQICKQFACILDYGIYNNHLFIVMNYIEGEEMGKFNKNLVLTEKHVNFLTKLFKQLIYAVSLLHDRKISHLDIKPQNIIIDKNENLYLVDLGLSCMHKNCISAGTINYMLPSIMNKKNISFETSMTADYWSIGATFLYSIGWLDTFLKYTKLPENQGIKLLIDSGFNDLKQTLLNLNANFLLQMFDLLTTDDKERNNNFKKLVSML